MRRGQKISKQCKSFRDCFNNRINDLPKFLALSMEASCTRGFIGFMGPKEKHVKGGYTTEKSHPWEILRRIPTEAIMRCQCVCKTWYDVIKNPSFITKQMILSAR